MSTKERNLTDKIFKKVGEVRIEERWSKKKSIKEIS